MIEFKPIVNNTPYDDVWAEITGGITSIVQEDFRTFKFKINGVIYTSYSEEVQEQFNKAKIWHKLSNKVD